MHDLQFAFRQLLRHKGSSLLSILILALGIGGSTAVFSVADKVLLRPIPGQDTGRLYSIREVNSFSGFRWDVSPSLLGELLTHTNLIESMTYFKPGSVEKEIQLHDRTRRISGATVAPNFFELLKVRPVAGRAFFSDEGSEGKPEVILLSHGLWQRHFGGRPDLIGQAVQLDGRAHIVVGILGPNFHFPGQSEFWIPQVIPTLERSTPWEPEDGMWRVFVRLRNGVAVQDLQTVLDTVGAAWQRDLPPASPRWRFLANSARDDYIHAPLKKTLWSLQGMLGALWFIACANVGNLMLARTFSRRGELGIRMAIGAGRGRIARQLLTESLVLAGLAAFLGLFCAWGGIVALEQFYLPRLSIHHEIDLNGRVLAAAGFLSVMASVLFGTAPAWVAARLNVNQALKGTAQQLSGGIGARLYQEGFVVIQVSLAVVLLAGAGMMIHSVVNLLRVDPGLEAKGLFVVRYDVASMMNSKDEFEAALRRGLSPREARAQAHSLKIQRVFRWQQQMLEKLQSVPGIEAAAVSDRPGGALGCWIEGRSDLVRLDKGIISVRTGDYFHTVRVPLLAGRWLTKADAIPGEQAVIVNEQLANECWPGQDPIGKWLRPPSAPPGNRVEPERIVVGVVKNIEDHWLGTEVKPAFYEPYERLTYEQAGGLFFTPGDYIFRSQLDLEVLRETHRRLGQEMSPRVELIELASVEGQLYASTAPRRLLMWLLITLGGLGLLLSVLGVYAVLAYAVACRIREIGIRMALGARRGQVRSLFFRQGFRLIVNGMILGITVAITAGHYIESLLFDVTPADPWALAAMLLTLGVAGGAACWLPAQRAANADPMLALRHE